MAFVLFVAELPEEDEGLLEVLNGDRDAAGMNEREREVVECQRLRVPVAQLTDDRERCSMLLRCLFAVALTPKLRSDLVQSKGSAMAIDFGPLPRTSFDDITGPMSCGTSYAVQALRYVELVEAVAVTAPEPPSCLHEARSEQEGQRSDEDDAESGGREHSGQQEPEPPEREHATPQPFSIDYWISQSSSSSFRAATLRRSRCPSSVAAVQQF